MAVKEKRNIYSYLQDAIKIFGPLLDVGCGKMNDFFVFHSSSFSKLEGLDEAHVNEVFYFLYFKGFIEKQLTKEESGALSHEKRLKMYKDRYEIFSIGIKDFDFTPNKYGLIICNHVLHLISDEDKFKLIDDMYNAIKPGGLLYLRLNHNEHPEDTNLSNTTRNFGGSYIPNHPDYWNNERNPRYLVNSDEFTAKLKEYHIIHEYSERNCKDFTRVIRK